MGTLNNSLWSVCASGLENSTDTVKFATGGKAVILFPDGNATKGCWAETHDGYFILQSHCSPKNQDDNLTYIGVFGEDMATGYVCGTNSMCCGFTMKKEQ